MVEAPTDTRLMALGSMARSGIDYNFFQILSDRIDQANGDEQKKLADLREKLLSYTQELDQQIKLQMEQAEKLLNKINQAENIEQVTAENINQFNNFFVELLKNKLEEASAAKDQALLEKLQRIVTVLQQASAPPGSELIETLLAAPDESTRLSLLNQHSEEITPEFIQMFGGLVTEYEQQNQDPSLLQKLQETYKSVIKFSMQANFNA